MNRYGRGYVFFNHDLSPNTSASEASYIFDGEENFDYFGSFVSVGDLNGDALDDIFWGARGNGYGGYSSGSTYVNLSNQLPAPGVYSADTIDYMFYGPDVYLGTGQYGTIASDIDGDGMNEIVFGSYHSDYFSTDGGLVSVFSACEN